MTFEYFLVDIEGKSIDQIEAYFNTWGRDGWEAVGATNVSYQPPAGSIRTGREGFFKAILFKRPTKKEAKHPAVSTLGPKAILLYEKVP